jgi:hypothetical protein
MTTLVSNARPCVSAEIPTPVKCCLAILFSTWLICGAAGQTLQNSPFGPPLSGSGDVRRTLLTRTLLMGTAVPPTPVDDSAAFGIPEEAAEPTEAFEGTLTLNHTASRGTFSLLAEIFGLVSDRDSPWKHLPPIDIVFVASGSHLIPAQQGVVITGSPVWNYIVGPGRVWQERDDNGYTRASFPFALVQRNQNCVHNGEMAFLFSNSTKPNLSNVYYQITQETCYPMKFNLWGLAAATYTPGSVANARTIASRQAQEFSRRMPTKPWSAWAKDFPTAGVDGTSFLAAYQHPQEVTTYGVVANGIHYSSGCPTRFGEYAYCQEMRLPSYSIAKSVFAGVALMRLGELYGRGVYGELIKNYVPEYKEGGNWDRTTFNNVSDMASGNYNLPGYEADEDSPAMDAFLVAEKRQEKLKTAFAIHQQFVTPGTKWVYQSSATFILTQAMNAYLQQKQGTKADLFNMVRDDVYIPLHWSQGGLTTIRTDNSPSGAPSGYYGLFFNKDDIAKIANFLNDGSGRLDGNQVLDPQRLKESLLRGPDPAAAGVRLEDSSLTSVLGRPSAAPNGRRYVHGFWGRYLSNQEFPQLRCSFWVAIMSGYGGNVVALMPNGTIFYRFSDGNEFPWSDAVLDLAKLAPPCQ